MSFKSVRGYILLVILLLAACVYIYRSIQYYYSIHPEKVFSTQIDDLPVRWQGELNMNKHKNDTVQRFYGLPSVKVNPDMPFGPGHSVSLAEQPSLGKSSKALIITDLYAEDFNGIGAVVQVDDSNDQTIYWNDQPIAGTVSKWKCYAFLYDLDTATLKRASRIKFFTINKEKKTYNVGSFRMRLY